MSAEEVPSARKALGSRVNATRYPPLTVGQKGRHYVCCSVNGGREPACNPVGGHCAYCWRGAA